MTPLEIAEERMDPLEDSWRPQVDQLTAECRSAGLYVREEVVMLWRSGLWNGKTYPYVRIGEVLGLSPEGARQVMKKAESKLRRQRPGG